MDKSSRAPWVILALLVLGLIVAGAFTLGFAQTITIAAIASTALVFFFLIQVSQS